VFLLAGRGYVKRFLTRSWVRAGSETLVRGMRGGAESPNIGHELEACDALLNQQ
jgi:hypothetical protein